MATFEQKQFPLGWLPSDDEFNGRRDGLLRMDNLHLDENGIVSLVRGRTVFASIPGVPSDVYSRRFTAGTSHYWHVSGTTYADGAVLLSGGSANIATFNAAYGYVFVASGTQKVKDAQGSTFPWGLTTPSAPAVADNGSNTLDDFNYFLDWTAIEGTNESVTGDHYEALVDSLTFRFKGAIGPLVYDTMNFPGVYAGSDDDIISINVRISDTSSFVKLRLEFIVTDALFPEIFEAVDFYWKEWSARDDNSIDPDTGLSGSFVPGVNQWTKLEARRGDFGRVGITEERDWSTVTAIRVSGVGLDDSLTVLFRDITFTGGPKSGYFEYRQVNIRDDGNYLAKSAPSAIADISIQRSSVQVTPSGLGTGDTTSWIYRRIDGVFYKINEGTAAFEDLVEDATALAENEILDENVLGPPDDIIGIVGPYFDRFLCLTPTSIWPSLPLNPDGFSPFDEIRLAGGQVETNLFICAVSNSSVLIGTTKDIYEISGKLLNDPVTGILDVNVRALGVSHPPVSRAFTNDKGILFYLANDGWRALAGSESRLLSQDLDLLFAGDSRYGINQLRKCVADDIKVSCTIAQNKLWCAVEHTTLGRALHIYDFARQYWTFQYRAGQMPMALHTEENGNLFAGCEDSKVRTWNTGTEDTPITLRTLWNDNQQPLNRKDSYTLKLDMDTGGVTVNVTLRGLTDNETPTVLATTKSSSGRSEIPIDIGDVGLVKKYQLEITCAAIQTFALYGWAIEYGQRPTQVSRLTLQANNLGTYARKRIIGIPFVIDTLGNNINYVPKLDDTVLTGGTLFSEEKRTRMHWFTSDTVGVDIAGTLESADPNEYFEFYEIDPSQAVFEKLPNPTRFMLLPPTNFGTAARKRFNRISFIVDPRGTIVSIVPILDGVAQSAQTITGTRKQTFSYYFPTDVTPVDVSAQLSASTEFEFYEMIKPEILEILPEPVRYVETRATDFGTAARKRFNRITFVLNPRNGTVSIVPLLDGVAQTAQTVVGNRKLPFNYYFDTDVTPVDVAAKLSSSVDFEFYEILKPEILEVLPEPVTYLRTRPNDFGTYSRKRVSRIPFVIDTRGDIVSVAPVIDGVEQATQLFQTFTKTLVNYFFTTDEIFRAISLNINGNTYFEFYDILKPEILELLPEPVRFLRVPPTNFGHAGKKRLRTIPLIIDTRGSDVTFTPILDGVSGVSQSFNTNTKKTVFYYADSDFFPIDFSGILQGPTEFEFYGFGQPENVEVLPVSKRFDQVGPLELNRIGKIRRIRPRLITEIADLTLRIYDRDSLLLDQTLQTVPDIDRVYDISLPKGVNSNICRVELQSTEPFVRLSTQFYIDFGGSETEYKIVTVNNSIDKK